MPVSCFCHYVLVQGKKHIKADARGAYASVITDDTETQYGPGATMTALMKGTKQACFCLQLAVTFVAPLGTDNHMQRSGLAIAKFRSHSQNVRSNCIADNKFCKGQRAPCSSSCYKEAFKCS